MLYVMLYHVSDLGSIFVMREVIGFVSVVFCLVSLVSGCCVSLLADFFSFGGHVCSVGHCGQSFFQRSSVSLRYLVFVFFNGLPSLS